MWICPVCNSKNIDNASLCLNCAGSRLCNNCATPVVGEACSSCGVDLTENIWLCEKDYNEMIASVSDAPDTLKTDSVDAMVVSASVSAADVADSGESVQKEEPAFTDGETDESRDSKPEKKKETPPAAKAEKKKSAEKSERKKDAAVHAKADKKKEPVKSDDRNKKRIIPVIIIALVFVVAAAICVYMVNFKDDAGDISDVNSGGVINKTDDNEKTSETNAEELPSDFAASDATEGVVNSDLTVSSDGEITYGSDASVVQNDSTGGQSGDDKKYSEYTLAVSNFNNGNIFEAYRGFKALGNYADSEKYLKYVAESASKYLSAGYNHTIGLRRNGTVVATGNNDHGKADIGSWINIVDVSARGLHSVGLRNDGTMIATGSNEDGQCNVGEFSGIADVKAGAKHTLAKTNYGTAVAVGNNDYGQCNVSSWSGIKEVSSGAYHSVALKNDGTVVAVGNNKYGQCNVADWKDIVSISAGDWYTVGLKSDGTVVSAGNNYYGQRNLSSWKDIIYISAGLSHTVGVKKDGTVVAAGSSANGECSVSSWNNVMTVSAGYRYTVAICSDGKVISCGDNADGQCYASLWTGIAS